VITPSAGGMGNLKTTSERDPVSVLELVRRLFGNTSRGWRQKLERGARAQGASVSAQEAR